jgi:hypothetical protein
VAVTALASLNTSFCHTKAAIQADKFLLLARDEVESTKEIMRTARPVGGFRARGQTTIEHGLMLSLRNRLNAGGVNGRSRQPQSNSSTADTGPNGSSLAGRLTYPTRER